MTESSAAAAIQTTLSLPTLRQGQGPPGAVGRLQHIFNDFAKADDDPRIFDESGVFGPKTNDAVREFQRNNGLQVDGIVGKNTWKALLEQWVALRPLPLN
jgi:peptidoglycan hydrolase-like protein with peptidoglycan-binding domain